MPLSRLFFPLALAAFALTLFLSATLLFLIQPMIGKMVLPLLGGTPAVWNTCMVFFQATLLAGYLYAHAVTTRLKPGAQRALHAGVLLLPFLTLPIAVDPGGLQTGGASPVSRLLVGLLLSAGLPFFVVSTSAPLLQRWFAATGHPAGRDPYFLYAASNCGSLLALLAYPTLIEPHLRLAHQGRLWVAGYAVLAALILVCAALAWRSPASPDPPGPAEAAPAGPTPERRAHWVALAFVPSSLMLGATTYLTTDIASVPLLWVTPLALYLLSFVVAFARPPLRLRRALAWALPKGVLLVIYLIISGTQPASWSLAATVGLHLAVFFIAATVCHGELAAQRPPTRHLTEFYLWMSFGGVLGGLFNALIAPVVFSTVMEYPLALMLACLLLPRSEPATNEPRSRRIDLVAPLALGVLAVLLFSEALALHLDLEMLGPILLAPPGAMGAFSQRFFPDTLLKFGAPVALCYLFVRRPTRFGLAIGAVLAAGVLCTYADPSKLHWERSFFGVVAVERSGEYHRLLHGTTIHGMQSRDPARLGEPLTYYHRDGPIGQLFAARNPRRFAVIGLGTGTMASYGGPGRSATFYEIDPAVERIARNPDYFTYLQDCRDRGGAVDVVLGDARLRLAEAREPGYDAIVVDAFSSDAIPVHLITREALDLYLTRLSENGVLAFHISNRYLELEPVLGNLIRKRGLAGRVRVDRADVKIGKSASQWVVIARTPAGLGALAEDARWKPLSIRPEVGVWTDDFSNVFRVLR